MSEFIVKDDGTRVLSETGAARQNKAMKGRFDLIPTEALRRLALHYEGGAKAYGDRNWEKGLPLSSFYNSGQRHLLAWASGEGTEDHLAAVMWNAAGAMWTQEQIRLGNLPESLNDMPGLVIPLMAKALDAIDRMREKLPEQAASDAGVKPSSEWTTAHPTAISPQPEVSSYPTAIIRRVTAELGAWEERAPYTDLADQLLKEDARVATPARDATPDQLERLVTE